MMKKKEIDILKKCRICGSNKFYEFLNLGNLPIPNGFLKKEELKQKEKKYPLIIIFCRDCYLVQLKYIVNPEIMFQNYLYIPSSSQTRLSHFRELAVEIKEQMHLNEKSLVVDIGSNDGSLLKCFKNLGLRVLGVEPAENLAKIAELNGINTIRAYFTPEIARKIVSKHKKASAMFATNVLAHIGDLHEFMKGVEILVNKDGIFVAQFPYIPDLITKNQFDTIYHEHLSYFSLKPLIELTDSTNLEIFQIERNDLDGGCIRVFWKKRSNKGIEVNKEQIRKILSFELKEGFYKTRTYREFAKRVKKIKIIINKELLKLKRKNKHIIGYGAAAKGNIFLNYCKIGRNIIDYLVDSTPYKQGLYTPGMYIPIYDESKILETKPDYVLILVWNFKDEIMRKNQEYRRIGKFIVCIPEFFIQ